VESVFPFAGLQPVFDLHTTVISANDDIDNNDVVWIIPYCTKRVSTYDTDSNRAARCRCRSTTQGSLVPGFSFDVRLHLEASAPICRELAGSLPVNAKIPDVWILAISDRVIAESYPELGPRRSAGKRHHQYDGHEGSDHMARTEFHASDP